jgi:N-carbamoyl-L-amino-acid hydrolase
LIRVDGERLRADFEALCRIGATEAGGVHRPSFTTAHLDARAWFLARAEAAGLETRVDAAGNHSAILGSHRPTLLLGSHLDSVPDGGRYDGALGVVAALHVLLAVQRARLELPFALEAIDFTDEEGTLVGALGSEALAGTLAADALRNPRGGRDALLAGLERAGLREDRLAEARRDPSTLAGYLELHVEQGPRLEREGAQIGVVTGIVGTRSLSLRFRGRAAHAGTTPMDARADAGVGAAAFVAAVPELVAREFPGCAATVGAVRFEPGAFNVVPGAASVALDFRSPEPAQLDELEEALLARARAAAEAHGLGLDAAPVGRWQPTPLDPGICDAIERAAARLGLESIRLPSGAGHDANALARVTRAGLIFVPSAGGVSHRPDEHTPWEDCLNGANTLLGTVLELAGRGSA